MQSHDRSRGLGGFEGVGGAHLVSEFEQPLYRRGRGCLVAGHRVPGCGDGVQHHLGRAETGGPEPTGECPDAGPDGGRVTGFVGQACGQRRDQHLRPRIAQHVDIRAGEPQVLGPVCCRIRPEPRHVCAQVHRHPDPWIVDRACHGQGLGHQGVDPAGVSGIEQFHGQGQQRPAAHRGPARWQVWQYLGERIDHRGVHLAVRPDLPQCAVEIGGQGASRQLRGGAPIGRITELVDQSGRGVHAVGDTLPIT
ncbi:Uncharacterised protein [Mycobacteroides abscessus subsp. abscessus]|nr:Uncharacterised protein [Mycobacteroides abscessus subsp. abscessus]